VIRQVLHKRFLVPLLVIVACLAAILPCAVCLAMAVPDSGPTINAVYAFQNLAQNGDQLYLIDETTTYTTPPAPPLLAFSQAFVVRLIAADGTTVLAAADPFTFFNNGYSRNIIAIYFNAASAPAWEGVYTVQIIGNPLVTWAGSTPLTTSAITWWSPMTGMSLNQHSLSALILTLASYIDTAWGYAGTTSDLLQSTTSGQALSTTGQSVFLGILPGLTSLAPSAFASAVSQPTVNFTGFSTLTNGTGTATYANPTINLNSNGGSLITVTDGGSFIVTLQGGIAGTVTSGTGTVTGSPQSLVAGPNTVYSTVGNFTITLMGANVQAINNSPLLTPWDFTGVSAALGLSTGWGGAILTFGIIFGVDIWLGRKMKSNKGLILIDDFIFVACTVAGFLSPAIIAVGAVIFGFFTVNALFFSKSYA
jgi:hypothetical protein